PREYWRWVAAGLSTTSRSFAPTDECRRLGRCGSMLGLPDGSRPAARTRGRTTAHLPMPRRRNRPARISRRCSWRWARAGREPVDGCCTAASPMAASACPPTPGADRAYEKENAKTQRRRDDLSLRLCGEQETS